MPYTQTDFDTVSLMQVPVADGQLLSIVTGVAVIDLHGDSHEGPWRREQLEFSVPDQTRAPLHLHNYADSTVIVFPATFHGAPHSPGKGIPGDIGWGVDNARSWAVLEDGLARILVGAQIVAAGHRDSVLLRIGFQVSVLGR
jgi:hypothetical protein